MGSVRLDREFHGVACCFGGGQGLGFRVGWRCPNLSQVPCRMPSVLQSLIYNAFAGSVAHAPC